MRKVNKIFNSDALLHTITQNCTPMRMNIFCGHIKTFPGSAVATIALLLLVFGACTEPATVPEPVEELSAELASEAGRLSYMTYCLNCHGDSGKGDGPLVELITMTPSDLTILSQDNGGVFPAERVDGVIRGYDEELMIAHGDREMPVWESVWIEQISRSNATEIVDARVAEIMSFLETIQTH